MKIIKNLTFATLAALAATLLFQTSITRADDHGQRDEHGQQAKVTFTKWVTAYPAMTGVVGGDVGDGIFTGMILGINVMDPETGVNKIEALYHFDGPKHSFTALVHVEQTGLNAVIIGVVTEGWLKGHAVEGEYTQFACTSPNGKCFEGTLAIARDSRDSIDN